MPSAPEQGAARLGASAVALAPLTFTFRVSPYAIYTAPRDQYPYRRLHPTPLVDSGVHDASGVRMHRIGTRLYDHPVGQAGYGIDNLESYVLNGDVRFLNRAKAQAARLMLRARKVGSAWYLPYPFDFYLHGRQAERMAAPWYSAMAQGQAITLFVRLFEVTNDQTYRAAADGVFASFLRPKAGFSPWVVWVDSYRHLWLEEYPKQAADRTLNGHLFATFGMWDYWRLTQDERAKTLYQGALTTVANYFTTFRTAKWISQYCLSHPTVLNDTYHLIHISELLRAFTMTRGLAFLRLAETLMSDYPPPSVTGSVRFAAGTHQGVKFNSNGTVASLAEPHADPGLHRADQRADPHPGPARLLVPDHRRHAGRPPRAGAVRDRGAAGPFRVLPELPGPPGDDGGEQDVHRLRVRRQRHGAEPGDRHDDRGDVVRRRRLRAVERPGIPARRDRSAGRPLDQPGHAGHLTRRPGPVERSRSQAMQAETIRAAPKCAARADRGARVALRRADHLAELAPVSSSPGP